MQNQKERRTDSQNKRPGYGGRVKRHGAFFRLSAIPKDIERAFSKRRQAIEKAAETYGYKTPKGMEQAALRTRQAKRPSERNALFSAWKKEARTLGFDLGKARQAAQSQPHSPAQRQPPKNTAANVPSRTITTHVVSRLLASIATNARASSRMPGVRISLRQRSPRRDNEAER